MIKVLLVATLILLPAAFAQAMPVENERPSVAAMSTPPNVSLAQGIARFRLQLAPIEAALEKSHQNWNVKTGAPPVGMAAVDPTTTSRVANPPAIIGKAMPAAAGCCGMMGTMSAAGAPPSTMQSDLPGFPGVSHIYHVGATGFFLDYSTALKLSTDQTVALNRIKEKSMGDAAAAQRQIDQAEQELWMLTGSDQPDSMTLKTQVRDIEKGKGDQRIAFIRAVGEAARVLTDDQRTALLGTAAPAAAAMPAPKGSAGSADPRAGTGSANPKPGTPSMADDPMDNMDSGKDAKPKVTSGTKDQ